MYRKSARGIIPCLLTTLSLFLIPVFSFAQEEFEPPEITNGERLFLETRFAQFFSSHSGGDANFQLAQGDPVLDETETTGAPMPGPFAGMSMNCRACHFVDAFLNTDGEGNFIPGDPSNVLMKTYSDFARRSPIPDRAEDNATHTPRNSPPLVNSAWPRSFDPSFHFDGEFASMEDLVVATLTGRNYGWLPVEYTNSIHHIAHIIRHDDGQSELAQEFGGIPYFDLLTRTDLPEEFQLPGEFLISPAASDEEIVDAVARIIAAYVNDLAFSTDEEGNFNLTPYDKFLEINNLPRQPGNNESNLDYSRRLRDEILQKETAGQLLFVQNGQDGSFMFHEQDFQFGPEELAGLKVFMKLPGDGGPGGTGNCVSCHTAPAFSDFSFHNTGATQKEYDGIHGSGAFASLHIPGYTERLRNHNLWLPATAKHPNATGVFRDIPALDKPGHTDLGMWNIFANRDFRKSQRVLWHHLCGLERGPGNGNTDVLPGQNPPRRPDCGVPHLLDRAIGLFKTAGLRDLGHSAPYFHNGQEDTLEDTIEFYRAMSDLARAGQLRNGDPRIADILVDTGDIAPLVRFLESLNEDYE